ncbi:MAG: hypothetical protein AAB805_01690 [Patescibacteria group bacterium]
MTIFSGFIILALVIIVIALVMYAARLSDEIKRLRREVDKLEGVYEEREIPEDNESDSFGH